MSHETTPLVSPTAQPPRTHFLRFERLVFLGGAAAVGAGAGFTAAVAMGRQDMWTQLLGGAPLLAGALCLACATFVEARKRRMLSCSIIAAVHGATLILWPLFLPLHATLYWLAPGAAMLSVILVASCWNGPASAIYRAAAQAMLVAALASYQGLLIALGA